MTRSQRSFMQKARQRRARRCPDESSQAKGVRVGRNGKLIMNRTELRRTAYHEAGHAVICSLLGIRYEFVSIVPCKGLLGRVVMKRSPIWRAPNTPVSRKRIERQILNCFAGGIAERLARRDGRASGLSADWDAAVALMKRFPEYRTKVLAVRYTMRAHARADVLVRRHWSEIYDVAEMPLEEKTISEGAVLSVLRKEAEFASAKSRLRAKLAAMASHHSLNETRGASGDAA
jgi:hypothetical protein